MSTFRTASSGTEHPLEHEFSMVRVRFSIPDSSMRTCISGSAEMP